MVLLKNGFDLHSTTSAFVQSARSLFIYVPYIKANTLSTLLGDETACKAIFVRWEIKDLLGGASDLAVYDFCASRNIVLFRNPRLHLKAYVDDYKACLLTTANISSRALSVEPNRAFNFEIGTIVKDLSVDDRLYFAMIEQSSVLITPQIFTEIRNKVENAPKNYENVLDNFSIPDTRYLISSLPMSNFEELESFYFNKVADSEVLINCAIHDLALYQIPFGLTHKELFFRLKSAFYTHPFIVAFDSKIKERGEIYFGEAKAWIQENCSNVPIPRRWEITENIQLLYQWFVSLGPDEYAIDRPNYSERLYCL